MIAGFTCNHVIPDLIGDLFKRNNGDGARNGIVFFFFQMNDPLVGAATEMELRVSELGDERTIDEGVDVWQDLLHTIVRQNLLVGE